MTPLLIYTAGVAMGSIVTATLLWPHKTQPAPVQAEPAPVAEPVESDDARDVHAALELLSFNLMTATAAQRLPIDTDGLSPRAGYWLAEMDVKSSAKMLAAMRRSVTAWEDHRDGIQRVPGVPPVESMRTYDAIIERKNAGKMIAVPDLIANISRLTRESFDD